MYLPHIVRKTVNIFRRPSLQKVMTLLVSTLLAMSLGYATMTLAPPWWGKDVASFLPGSPAIVARLDVASGQVFHRQVFVSAQMTLQRTEQQQTTRRFA